MKCGVCKRHGLTTTLQRVGFVRKSYKNREGHTYKTIQQPRYASCPRLNDPKAHPARAKKPHVYKGSPGSPDSNIPSDT